MLSPDVRVRAMPGPTLVRGVKLPDGTAVDRRSDSIPAYVAGTDLLLCQPRSRGGVPTQCKPEDPGSPDHLIVPRTVARKATRVFTALVQCVVFMVQSSSYAAVYSTVCTV